MDNAIKLLGVIIWPITALIILLLFKRQIIGLTELIRSVEAPGGFKLFLDREKVEKIIKEGAKENISTKQLAEQIIKSAEIKDTSEMSILRALFDEEGGRFLWNYRKYLPEAIKSLSDKGYIEKRDKRYFLTTAGLAATQKYLINTLVRQGVPIAAPDASSEI
jgi:hypothetical protein